MPLRSLHRSIRPAAELLVQLARDAGMSVRVTSARRSSSWQAREYARFLRGLTPYPVAPPGRSMHERGMAFDLAATPADLKALGQVWEAWGGRWGGRFRNPDPIHFDVKT